MTSALKLPKLSNLSAWHMKYSPTVQVKVCRGRNYLINFKMVKQSLAEMNLNQSFKGKILDIYPGPGLATRALLSQTQATIVSMECCPEYTADLEALVKASQERMKFSILDATQWTSYSALCREGDLLSNIEKQPWDKIHSDLFIHAHIPVTALCEQFFVQIMTSLMYRTWLFAYGAVQIGVWVDPRVCRRFLAPPGSPDRNPTSIKAQAFADMKVIMEPDETEFFSNRLPGGPKSRHSMASLTLLLITPKLNPPNISLEGFEYILRQLFITKRHKLRDAITCLGFAADQLLAKLDPAIIPQDSITVAEMTFEQFVEVQRVFESWELRPRILVDYDPAGMQDLRK